MIPASSVVPIRLALAGACVAAALAAPPAAAAPSFALVSGRGPTSVPVGYNVAAISGNGRWVAYVVRPGGDVADGIEPLANCTHHASCGHPASNGAVLSADGKAVAYLTNGAHDAGDTDHSFDVYVHRQ